MKNETDKVGKFRSPRHDHSADIYERQYLGEMSFYQVNTPFNTVILVPGWSNAVSAYS